jgi:hypothetical protein
VTDKPMYIAAPSRSTAIGCDSRANAPQSPPSDAHHGPCKVTGRKPEPPNTAPTMRSILADAEADHRDSHPPIKLFSSMPLQTDCRTLAIPAKIAIGEKIHCHG